jgi:hypothetical protein
VQENTVATLIEARLRRLGSLRVLGAGNRLRDRTPFLKDCFGETPKPARETRALPETRGDTTFGRQRSLAFVIRHSAFVLPSSFVIRTSVIHFPRIQVAE